MARYSAPEAFKAMRKVLRRAPAESVRLPRLAMIRQLAGDPELELNEVWVREVLLGLCDELERRGHRDPRIVPRNPR
jgi:hypothetical protein